MGSILNTALDAETLQGFKAFNNTNNYLPPETLDFSEDMQRRLEHRKRNIFKFKPAQRGGIESSIKKNLVSTLRPSSVWLEASVQDNFGSSAMSIGVEASKDESWADLESYVPEHTSENEIMLRPLADPPIPNAFIHARVSVQPLLSVLNFKTVSPLLSILWADTTGCGLYEYYHFLRWYSQLRSGDGDKKLHLGDKRDRPDRRKPGDVFQGIGITILDACIAQVVGDEILPHEREVLYNALNQLPEDDAKHELILKLLR